MCQGAFVVSLDPLITVLLYMCICDRVGPLITVSRLLLYHAYYCITLMETVTDTIGSNMRGNYEVLLQTRNFVSKSHKNEEFCIKITHKKTRNFVLKMMIFAACLRLPQPQD